MLKKLVVCLALILNANTIFATDLPTSTPEAQGLSSVKLAKMLTYLQTPGLNVDSVILARNGQVVLETYAAPNDASVIHQLNSATKSVMSALLGIAIHDGKLKLSNTVADVLPQYADMPNAKALTIEKLVSMQTGVEWISEYYGGRDWMDARLSDDWIKTYLSHPIQADRIGKFTYNSAESDLLAALIETAVQQPLADYAQLRLFEPLGIKHTRWVQNKQGQYGGARGLYIAPRDMLKFGELYRNNGLYQGQQIIPADWVAYSTHTLVPTGDRYGSVHYGAQWWIGKDRAWFAAQGAAGQIIAVFPKENITLVMTAKYDDQGYSAFGLDALQQTFLQISEKSAVPPAAQSQLEQKISEFKQGAGISTLTSPLAQQLNQKSIRFNDFWLAKLKFQFKTDHAEIEYTPRSFAIKPATLGAGFNGQWLYTADTSSNDEWRKLGAETQIAARLGWLDKKTLQVDTITPEESGRYGYKLTFNGNKVQLEEIPSGKIAYGILE